MEPTLQMNPLESQSVIEIFYEVVTCDEPIEVTATVQDDPDAYLYVGNLGWTVNPFVIDPDFC